VSIIAIYAVLISWLIIAAAKSTHNLRYKYDKRNRFICSKHRKKLGKKELALVDNRNCMHCRQNKD
jgi:hypothetical protein